MDYLENSCIFTESKIIVQLKQKIKMDKEKRILYHKNQALYELLESYFIGSEVHEKKTYDLIMECNDPVRLEFIALNIYKVRKAHEHESKTTEIVKKENKKKIIFLISF